MVLFMSTVISVRIRREIKETLEESGVDISEEVRRFLEELAWRVKTRKFIERWNELLKDVKPSEKGFSVKSVREDRESH
jgi:antitoxin component of RelBE/YafQ-DinJ toxin-antitoxin module